MRLVHLLLLLFFVSSSLNYLAHEHPWRFGLSFIVQHSQEWWSSTAHNWNWFWRHSKSILMIGYITRLPRPMRTLAIAYPMLKWHSVFSFHIRLALWTAGAFIMCVVELDVIREVLKYWLNIINRKDTLWHLSRWFYWFWTFNRNDRLLLLQLKLWCVYCRQLNGLFSVSSWETMKRCLLNMHKNLTQWPNGQNYLNFEHFHFHFHSVWYFISTHVYIF